MYYACKPNLLPGRAIGDAVPEVEKWPNIVTLFLAGDVIWEDAEGRSPPHLRPKIAEGKAPGYYANAHLERGDIKYKKGDLIPDAHTWPSITMLLRVKDVVWHHPEGKPAPLTLKHQQPEEPRKEGRRQNARA